MRFAIALAGAVALAAGCAAVSPDEDAGQEFRRAEAALLAAATDVRRRGRDLIVDRSGRPALVLRDSGVCEGFDTCKRWTYLGTIRFGAIRRRLVEMFHGEGEDVHAYDARGGELVFDTQPTPSPDGRFAATSGPDELEEYSFAVHRITERGAAVVASGFPYGCCRVVAWTNPERIRVEYDQDGRAKAGWVVQPPDGSWRLQPAG